MGLFLRPPPPPRASMEKIVNTSMTYLRSVCGVDMAPVDIHSRYNDNAEIRFLQQSVSARMTYKLYLRIYLF